MSTHAYIFCRDGGKCDNTSKVQGIDCSEILRRNCFHVDVYGRVVFCRRFKPEWVGEACSKMTQELYMGVVSHC
jgi:hypothetical protein